METGIRPSDTINQCRKKLASLPGTVPIFVVVAVIFYSMYSGTATPTEAGAVGAFVILVVALLKGMKWASLKEALLETAKLTVMIFALIWGVLIFVRFLGYAGLPQEFAAWITGLPFPPVVIMILILLGYAVLGMFMDAIGILLLTCRCLSSGYRSGVRPNMVWYYRC